MSIETLEFYANRNRAVVPLVTPESIRHENLVKDVLSRPRDVSLSSEARLYPNVVFGNCDGERGRRYSDILAIDGEKIILIEAKTTVDAKRNIFGHKKLINDMYGQLCACRVYIQEEFKLESKIIGVYRGGDRRGDFETFSEEQLKFFLGQAGPEALAIPKQTFQS